ncbi:MAG: HIT domain-containing protein [Synergistaceae bacterium]|nr:HIT domain-containing protein [Synergistaceae bacterium]
MDIIRAPWRMEYINSSNANPTEGCVFCSCTTDDDEENLIITRGKTCFTVLNRYPYSNGHLLVIPYRHTPLLESLTSDEMLELMTLSQAAVTALKKMMNPDGFNLGINVGKVAGAGIDAHIHFHVVPRWSGDTNFMSVTAETKVLPEALSVTRARLIDALKEK